jgi:hypothetical protein
LIFARFSYAKKYRQLWDVAFCIVINVHPIHLKSRQYPVLVACVAVRFQKCFQPEIPEFAPYRRGEKLSKQREGTGEREEGAGRMDTEERILDTPTFTT